ncbi:MAG: type IV pili methyl-accepting chemotaxis transducer N-terminal domain-containing protein [Burkholderiales bacterium]|nr:type IV pili methyl-accepting chemotaxis transducer N-terminal domain-containing protein [Burkholderiales bacterium]
MAFSISLPFGKPKARPLPAAGSGETVLDTITAAATAPRPTLPFIGHLPVERQYSLIGISLILWLLCLLVVVVKDTRDAGQLADGVAVSGDTLMHSQRLAKAVPGAVLGNAPSFAQLLESRDRIAVNLLALAGEGEKKVQTPQRVEAPLSAVREEWARSERNASVVLEQQKNLLVLGESIRAINANNPQLLALAEQVAALKLAAGAGPRDITATAQLVMLTQRMAKNANALIAGETIDPEVAFLLGKDTNTFRDLLTALARGSDTLRIAPSQDPEIRARLADLERSFVQYQQAVSGILGNMQRLVAAKQSAQRILADNEKLKDGLDAVAKAYAAELDGRAINYVFMALFAVLAAASIALMFFAFRADTEVRRQRAEKEENEARALNAQNQAAILRLMNELAEVADGDLTVQTTVNEDITGAIADSVNLTIEELRGVVMRINQATAQVTVATETAQETSARLLGAQDRQSVEIRDTGESVLRMARDIGEVSRGARQSAEVARQSVGAAQKGATAVQDSIAGMNEIREQIQETSKRIKRLGESSQEIGEIVELISDITEQTNVLALNAAIQAASAGEAGRGFSVVAEEVQRLAERSAEATRQIGAIVKAIQTDTQDAVSAMEKSTQGVVEGAKLADAAGQALSEIGTVSGRLSHLIEGIAATTSTQAESAAVVARSIEDILRVTEETTAGTRSTADSVRELGSLAQELKSSVSGFKVG